MNKISLLATLISSLLSASAFSATLITDAEGKLPSGEKIIATRAITRGPGIKIMSPDPAADKITSPFQLKIAFEPRGGAKIDTSSAKLTYLKSPNVELIDRIKGGLTEGGIEMATAEVPEGVHQIRISVQDNEGRQTNSILKLNVVK